MALAAQSQAAPQTVLGHSEGEARPAMKRLRHGSSHRVRREADTVASVKAPGS